MRSASICFLLLACLAAMGSCSRGRERGPGVALYMIPAVEESGCECANYSCGCCAHLDVPKIHLNDTGCVNFSYLPDEYGVSFTFSIDNKTIFNETISAKNPPPICYGVPFLEEYASVCIHFYDLELTRDKFRGCVKLEARLEHVAVGEYDLGCFQMPLRRKGMLSQVVRRKIPIRL
ncbi:PREDICTED: uncharacterized protein LOC106818918 [Priapulus caudatus]|uniref:Uncharacterized protein LOC106818918 n=1 Tax=Priapulus caudatus TaxID=37621 RepID=A0ABM1F3Q2_PRICU|nr:PREDICTED: uncharacterized protein LOC106818918 [Priapulus caudatus]